MSESDTRQLLLSEQLDRGRHQENETEQSQINKSIRDTPAVGTELMSKNSTLLSPEAEKHMKTDHRNVVIKDSLLIHNIRFNKLSEHGFETTNRSSFEPTLERTGSRSVSRTRHRPVILKDKLLKIDYGQPMPNIAESIESHFSKRRKQKKQPPFRGLTKSPKKKEQVAFSQEPKLASDLRRFMQTQLLPPPGTATANQRQRNRVFLGEVSTINKSNDRSQLQTQGKPVHGPTAHPFTFQEFGQRGASHQTNYRPNPRIGEYWKIIQTPPALDNGSTSPVMKTDRNPKFEKMAKESTQVNYSVMNSLELKNRESTDGSQISQIDRRTTARKSRRPRGGTIDTSHMNYLKKFLAKKEQSQHCDDGSERYPDTTTVGQSTQIPQTSIYQQAPYSSNRTARGVEEYLDKIQDSTQYKKIRIKQLPAQPKTTKAGTAVKAGYSEQKYSSKYSESYVRRGSMNSTFIEVPLVSTTRKPFPKSRASKASKNSTIEGLGVNSKESDNNSMIPISSQSKMSMPKQLKTMSVNDPGSMKVATHGRVVSMKFTEPTIDPSSPRLSFAVKSSAEKGRRQPPIVPLITLPEANSRQEAKTRCPEKRATENLGMTMNGAQDPIIESIAKVGGSSLQDMTLPAATRTISIGPTAITEEQAYAQHRSSSISSKMPPVSTTEGPSMKKEFIIDTPEVRSIEIGSSSTNPWNRPRISLIQGTDQNPKTPNFKGARGTLGDQDTLLNNRMPGTSLGQYIEYQVGNKQSIFDRSSVIPNEDPSMELSKINIGTLDIVKKMVINKFFPTPSHPRRRPEIAQFASTRVARVADVSMEQQIPNLPRTIKNPRSHTTVQEPALLTIPQGGRGGNQLEQLQQVAGVPAVDPNRLAVPPLDGPHPRIKNSRLLQPFQGRPMTLQTRSPRSPPRHHSICIGTRGKKTISPTKATRSEPFDELAFIHFLETQGELKKAMKFREEHKINVQLEFEKSPQKKMEDHDLRTKELYRTLEKQKLGRMIVKEYEKKLKAEKVAKSIQAVFEEGAKEGRSLLQFRTKKAILEYINYYEKNNQVFDYNQRNSPLKIPTPRMPEKFSGRGKREWRGGIFHRGKYDILTRIAHKYNKVKSEAFDQATSTSNEIMETLEKNSENINLLYKDFIGDLVLNFDENESILVHLARIVGQYEDSTTQEVEEPLKKTKDKSFMLRLQSQCEGSNPAGSFATFGLSPLKPLVSFMSSNPSDSGSDAESFVMEGEAEEVVLCQRNRLAKIFERAIADQEEFALSKEDKVFMEGQKSLVNLLNFKVLMRKYFSDENFGETYILSLQDYFYTTFFSRPQDGMTDHVHQIKIKWKKRHEASTLQVFEAMVNAASKNLKKEVSAILTSITAAFTKYEHPPLAKADFLMIEDQLDEKIGAQMHHFGDLISSSIEKRKFFQWTKAGDVNKSIGDFEDSSVIKQVADCEYLKACNEQQVLVQPFLAQRLVANTLTLVFDTISPGQAQAIKQLFNKIGSDRQAYSLQYSKEKLNERVVKHLRIEDCEMADEVFGLLLEGLGSQCKVETLTYMGNSFGLKSQAALRNLLEAQVTEGTHLMELNLSNLKGMSVEVGRKLIDSIYCFGRSLHRLRLSQIDLNDTQIVVRLCEIIRDFESLYSLNLAWTKLNAYHLMMIAYTLSQHSNCVRQLDLSCNQLVSSPKDESLHAKLFIELFKQYLANTEVLHHLNLSNMNLTARNLLELSHHLANCTPLMVIHLSNNALEVREIAEREVFESVLLNYFGILRSPKPSTEQTSHTEKFYTDLRERLRDLKDARKKKREAIIIGDHHSDQKKSKVQKRRDLIGSLQIKSISEGVRRTECQTQRGQGRQGDDLLGGFNSRPLVIYRKWSKCNNFDETVLFQQSLNSKACGPQCTHPGCASFNQSSVDELLMRWKVSYKSECFICCKHRYTMVFFDQRNPLNNMDLIKINNEELRKDIRSHIFSRMEPHNTFPLIFTMSPKGIDFLAKPKKMYQSSLSSLVSIASNPCFMKFEGTNAKDIMTVPVKHLVEDESFLQKLNVGDYLRGWHKALVDKIYKNELQDVQTLNEPEKISQGYSRFQNDDSTNHLSSFLFADYFEPGQHQILIYNPKTEEIWYSSLLVDSNKRDHYPDFLAFPPQNEQVYGDSHSGLARFDSAFKHLKIYPQYLFSPSEVLFHSAGTEEDGKLHPEAISHHGSQTVYPQAGALFAGGEELSVPFVEERHLEKILKVKHELFECKDLLRENMAKIILLYQSLLSTSEESLPKRKGSYSPPFPIYISRSSLIAYLSMVASEENKLQASIENNTTSMSKIDKAEYLNSSQLVQYTPLDVKEETMNQVLQLFFNLVNKGNTSAPSDESQVSPQELILTLVHLAKLLQQVNKFKQFYKSMQIVLDTYTGTYLRTLPLVAIDLRFHSAEERLRLNEFFFKNREVLEHLFTETTKSRSPLLKSFSLHSAIALLTPKKSSTPRPAKKAAAVPTILPFKIIVSSFIQSMYKPAISNQPTQELEDLNFAEFLAFLVRCSIYFDPFNPVASEEHCGSIQVESCDIIGSLTEMLKGLFEQNGLEKVFANKDFSQCVLESSGRIWENEKKVKIQKSPATEQVLSLVRASSADPQELLNDIYKM